MLALSISADLAKTCGQPIQPLISAYPTGRERGSLWRALQTKKALRERVAQRGLSTAQGFSAPKQRLSLLRAPEFHLEEPSVQQCTGIVLRRGRACEGAKGGGSRGRQKLSFGLGGVRA